MSATHGRRARRANRDTNERINASGVRMDGNGDPDARGHVMPDTDATVDSSENGTPGTSIRKARAALPVRIALGALAAVSLTATVLAAVNLHAATTFDQATQSLTEHIAQARTDTPDWSKLSAMQEQTDEQFDEAAAASIVLLPRIREAIAANAAVSDKLTALVKQNLAAQQGGSASSGSNGSSSDGSDQDQSSDPSSSTLTDEQRKQVEELLKANEQSTPSDKNQGTSKESTVTNNTGNTNKPW